MSKHSLNYRQLSGEDEPFPLWERHLMATVAFGEGRLP